MNTPCVFHCVAVRFCAESWRIRNPWYVYDAGVGRRTFFHGPPAKRFAFRTRTVEGCSVAAPELFGTPGFLFFFSASSIKNTFFFYPVVQCCAPREACIKSARARSFQSSHSEIKVFLSIRRGCIHCNCPRLYNSSKNTKHRFFVSSVFVKPQRTLNNEIETLSLATRNFFFQSVFVYSSIFSGRFYYTQNAFGAPRV